MLLNGDCMQLLNDVEARSVDLVLCDLPYGITTCHWDSVLPLPELWAHYKRILKPKGAVLLFGSQPFTSTLIQSNLPWFKQSLVWNKNKCGSPGLAKVRPMQVHEDIVVFAPGRTTYNPQMEKGEPYKRQSSREEGYVGRCNTHGYGLKPKKGFENTGTRYPKSIVSISRDFSAQQQLHPTQKPVPLLEWLIRTYSDDGALVLDNCMGVGSTGVACKATGRAFIGMELDKQYFSVAEQRLKNYEERK
jgi:DNA modification methylase